jgi:uncharacterized membrane protein YedE/YeeE
VSLSSILIALAGGGLIGLAASIAWIANGRIAGVSGTLARVMDEDRERGFRIAFLVGLLATGVIAHLVSPGALGASPRSLPVLAIAGLLVGLGTTWANGCTSGHGVCGLSRGSPRSLVAVATFMLTAAITVALVRP